MVAAISPLLLPLPGHYQFQYQGAILRPSILDEDLSSQFTKSRVIRRRRCRLLRRIPREPSQLQWTRIVVVIEGEKVKKQCELIEDYCRCDQYLTGDLFNIVFDLHRFTEPERHWDEGRK